MIGRRKLGAPAATSVDRLLAAESLSVGYGAVPVVREVSLEVRPGQLVALLGPNGAGKTTTLLALVGVLSPMAGRVIFRDSAVPSPIHRRARAGLAYIAEERSAFSRMSVTDNFRVARADMPMALRVFPELEEHKRRSVGLLSGGQQQMLSVALALARRPSLLIADELSLGLAPLVVDRLIDALRTAADEDGVGVLLVEQHVRKALRRVDHAYVMRRGRIALHGTADELTQRVDEIEASYLSVRSEPGAGGDAEFAAHASHTGASNGTARG